MANYQNDPTDERFNPFFVKSFVKTYLKKLKESADAA